MSAAKAVMEDPGKTEPESNEAPPEVQADANGVEVNDDSALDAELDKMADMVTIDEVGEGLEEDCAEAVTEEQDPDVKEQDPDVVVEEPVKDVEEIVILVEDDDVQEVSNEPDVVMIDEANAAPKKTDAISKTPPAKQASAKPSPAKPASVKPSPAKPALAKSAPAKPAPGKPAPAKMAPGKPAPVTMKVFQAKEKESEPEQTVSLEEQYEKMMYAISEIEKLPKEELKKLIKLHSSMDPTVLTKPQNVRIKGGREQTPCVVCNCVPLYKRRHIYKVHLPANIDKMYSDPATVASNLANWLHVLMFHLGLQRMDQLYRMARTENCLPPNFYDAHDRWKLVEELSNCLGFDWFRVRQGCLGELISDGTLCRLLLLLTPEIRKELASLNMPTDAPRGLKKKPGRRKLLGFVEDPALGTEPYGKQNPPHLRVKPDFKIKAEPGPQVAKTPPGNRPQGQTPRNKPKNKGNKRAKGFQGRNQPEWKQNLLAFKASQGLLNEQTQPPGKKPNRRPPGVRPGPPGNVPSLFDVGVEPISQQPLQPTYNSGYGVTNDYYAEKSNFQDVDLRTKPYPEGGYASKQSFSANPSPKAPLLKTWPGYNPAHDPYASQAYQPDYSAQGAGGYGRGAPRPPGQGKPKKNKGAKKGKGNRFQPYPSGGGGPPRYEYGSGNLGFAGGSFRQSQSDQYGSQYDYTQQPQETWGDPFQNVMDRSSANPYSTNSYNY